MDGIHSATYFFEIADKEALAFPFLLRFQSQNLN